MNIGEIAAYILAALLALVLCRIFIFIRLPMSEKV